jgi:hypothetical protein
MVAKSGIGRRPRIQHYEIYAGEYKNGYGALTGRLAKSSKRLHRVCCSPADVEIFVCGVRSQLIFSIPVSGSHSGSI